MAYCTGHGEDGGVCGGGGRLERHSYRLSGKREHIQTYIKYKHMQYIPHSVLMHVCTVCVQAYSIHSYVSK